MNQLNRPTQKSFVNSLLPWLSPSGAVIILVCFFLPWLEVRCAGKKIIGSGFTFANKAFPLWSVPIFAILIILLFFWYRSNRSLKWLKTGMMFLSSVGFLLILTTYWFIEKKLDGFFVRKLTAHQIKIGLIGTAVGFLLIVISTILIKSKPKNCR